MVKTLAALFMLIDHVGAILFPQVLALRIIGRLSMPLFAYCVAQGFYYSEKKETTKKYARNLLLFSVASQIPYGFWKQGLFPLNIGFTWLLALCLMKGGAVLAKAPSAAKEELSFCRWKACAIITVIMAVATLGPIDYGLYGVLFPVAFYMTVFRWNKPQFIFLGMAVLYALYVLMGGSLVQVFSLIAWPMLLIARRYDDKIRVPRRFFYWFYPVHITVLLILREVFFL